MKKEEKDVIISQLAEKLSSYPVIYITDVGGLTVEKANSLRRMCYNGGVQIQVAKNTLIKKAMERSNQTEYSPLFETLHGSSAVMFAQTGNAPAKIIQEFRRANTKPILKGAFVEFSVYIGDQQLDNLANLKSKNELIGDIIGLLQSPAKNVISALQSGGNRLAGIVKTLSEKPE